MGGASKLILDSVPIYQKKGIKTDVLVLKKVSTPNRQRQFEKKTSDEVFYLTKRSLYNPFLIFKIIPYLKKYDIIHAHLFPTWYWIVFAKMISFSSVPVVYTEHSTINKRRSHLLLSRIDRFLYPKLAFIGCISEGTYAKLTNFLTWNRNVKVISNGIDLKQFDPNREIDVFFEFFSETDIVLIQASSFKKEKDHKTIVNAMMKLPSNVKLLLVGEGKLREEVENQVKALNLTDRVKFLGARHDVPDLYQYADIILLSSHYEGFGLSAAEGMASRKPVIVSNVSGLSEVVKDYGLLFEKGNSEDLAQKILSITTDKELYNKIADSCFRGSQNYSIEKMVQEYISVYQKVLHNKSMTR